MQEKRKYIRIGAPVIVTYSMPKKQSGDRKAILKDFSEGGIRFPVYEKLKVGLQLKLNIEAPFDTIPIAAEGQIVWVKALSAQEGREIYDVGVQFIKIKPFDQKRLTEAAKNFLSMGQKYRAGY